MDPIHVALGVVDMAQHGRFTDIEALFAPPLRDVVSADTLHAAWSSERSRIGPATAVGEPTCEATGSDLVRVSVPVTGERGEHTVVMSVDDTGRLHGLRLAPSVAGGVDGGWTPPRYARPHRFAERAISLGSGQRAVGGTLTLPRRGGRWPGVVLLAGGGPFDRDQTVGPNKPLKDLAWGLASRGVAVARFDKVTHVHPDVATAPGFTMVEEYVPHALAAIDLLRRQPGVDRVFVLGHSAGGRTAPRVAAADPSVAGVIILAGDAAPLSRAAVRTARHVATVDPAGATQAALDLLTRQAALVESPDLSPGTATADLPFGWPASYWLDLRGYDQVATAAALDRPILILQGRRDYQVTVDDDLALWRAGLAHRQDVTIRVYDTADHFFFRGEGPSAPADHNTAHHVDPDVVAGIAEWLVPRTGITARLRRRT